MESPAPSLLCWAPAPLHPKRCAVHAALRRAERDPLPEVKDTKAYLATALAAYAQQQPGRVPALVAAQLPPEAQAQLQQWCAAAGVGLV